MEYPRLNRNKNQSAMGHFSLVIVLLSFQVGRGFPSPRPRVNEPSRNYGPHNSENKAVNRNVRCVPCEPSYGGPPFESRGAPPDRGPPYSNHLNTEYRGNGADNLGYDWSPMAWGGRARPQKSGGMMGYFMKGRDGRQMSISRESSRRGQGTPYIICDSCRTYYPSESSSRGGDYDGRGGRQFPGSAEGSSYYGRGGERGGSGRNGDGYRWYSGGREGPQDFEARVRSPTVGVLVKPGSRIAYIPSVSGDMFWDGKSGGGTRWDGFSNGISWVSPGSDGRDPSGRESKPGSYPGNEIYYTSGPSRPWSDDHKGISAWDSSGKGYYFADGYFSRDRGYASNWHYGSTNQNGWNGNRMKWNYGSKHWEDGSTTRYYYDPEGRSYGSRGGVYVQYGDQYPHYEPSPGYRESHGPVYRPTQGVRVNDRDPSSFSPQDHRERPWDYNSVSRFGDRRPSGRPDWRPDSKYPSGYDKDTNGKYPTPARYPSDKIDYDKPWAGRPGYGSSKPDSGSGYPFGGNRFPGSEDNGRPNGGSLFYPNNGGSQESGGGGGGNGGGGGGGAGSGGQPEYHGTSSRPGGYSSSGNQSGGSHPNGGQHGSNQSGGSYPTTERPSTSGYSGGGGGSHSGGGHVIYIGARPSGGGSSGYPGGSSNYPSGSGYPGGSSSYPGSPSGYPSTASGYPGSGPSFPISSSGYPSGSSYPSGGGYPEHSSRPSYGHSGGGSYPSFGVSSSGGYPGDSSRPSGGYRPIPDHGGSSYSKGRPIHGSSYPGDRANEFSSEGSGYYDGGYSLDKYPSRYPDYGGRPEKYYPSGGGDHGVYPGGSGSYPAYEYGGGYYSSSGRKGYYTGIITELGPDNRPYHGSRVTYYGTGHGGGGGNKERYPYGGDGYKYPGSYEDRYASGGGGDDYSRGRDRFYFYGQDSSKGSYPGNGLSGGDQHHGSSQDKNAWNYGENGRDGFYHRSGGSYPPYRGGPYYTSSYLASASTTSHQDSEGKTQSVTKPDDVTQPTPES